ncbi:HAMP domain-containing sensor histidine kinase [Gramella sp. AN32]|uniref:histidine kinase n=1 Tax=Christiangramia antarctica TaxID=2058158 RepID=A0ABW5X0Z3_9FLAO|nr:HAMP domain-containing sensor histidine kinase [Gramella sp. AN32]MCM4155612.1 sensor histidine kinase [Gramella sp. AN32]
MENAANLIESNSKYIMDTWEKKVREDIPASKNSSALALRNQLPNVLEDIAQIMRRYKDLKHIERYEEYEEIIKNSVEHGRHRAASEDYTVKQILKEYVIFHRVLTSFLLDKNEYTSEVGIILKYTLETAMLNSADSFTDSLQDMREKLIGTLAHDLRNPISAAYFALDIIDCGMDKDRFDGIKKMGITSLKKSLELLEGILEAITIKAGEGITLNFKEIDILEEIKWVYNEAKEMYSNKVIFETNTEKIIGVFDGTAIRRVVENLVTNAVKYGESRKTVKITVHDELEEVSICVHNFGKPISEAKQNEMFQFLNHSPNENHGELKSWGMGLTLVKTVARAHNGKVEIKSEENYGTEFKISLNKNSNFPGKIKAKLNYITS